MTTILAKRLVRLEGKPHRDLVMEALDAMGYEALAAHIATVPFKRDGSPISMARLLTLDVEDVLDLENFRGKVPDDILREAYASCRNYAVSTEVKSKVMEFGGV